MLCVQDHQKTGFGLYLLATQSSLLFIVLFLAQDIKHNTICWELVLNVAGASALSEEQQLHLDTVFGFVEQQVKKIMSVSQKWGLRSEMKFKKTPGWLLFHTVDMLLPLS